MDNIHTLISRNPGLSSRFLKGFEYPPSFSMFPAQTLHDIGFNRSAPRMIAKERRRTDTKVSMTMSRGTAAEDEDLCR